MFCPAFLHLKSIPIIDRAYNLSFTTVSKTIYRTMWEIRLEKVGKLYRGLLYRVSFYTRNASMFLQEIHVLKAEKHCVYTKPKDPMSAPRKRSSMLTSVVTCSYAYVTIIYSVMESYLCLV